MHSGGPPLRAPRAPRPQKGVNLTKFPFGKFEKKTDYFGVVLGRSLAVLHGCWSALGFFVG